MLLDEELTTKLVIRLREEILRTDSIKIYRKTTNLWLHLLEKNYSMKKYTVIKDEHFELCDAIAFVVGAEIDGKRTDIRDGYESKYVKFSTKI